MMSEEAPSYTVRRTPLVTIVIPMLNERAGLPALLSQVAGAIKGTGVEWELVLVDVGSTDGTREATAGDLPPSSRWRLIILSRKFGQMPASRAALEFARGDAVIFL